MPNFRFFPIALYLYVFGAAGLGFSVAAAMAEVTRTTVYISAVSCVMCLVAHYLVRPYMRQARATIKAQAQARMKPAVNEVESAEVAQNDAAH